MAMMMLVGSFEQLVFVPSISKLSVNHMLGYDKMGLKWRSRIKIDDFIFHDGIGSYRLPSHHVCLQMRHHKSTTDDRFLSCLNPNKQY